MSRCPGRLLMVLSLICALICAGSVSWIFEHKRTANVARLSDGDRYDSGACGQWCIFYVARILGVPLDWKEAVRVLPGPAPHSLWDVAKGLEKVGLKWEAQDIDFVALCKLQTPVICHLRSAHFATIVSATNDYVVLYDFPEKRRRMTASEFKAQWSGTVLLAKQSDNGTKPVSASHPSIKFNSLMIDAGDVAVSDGPVMFRYEFTNHGSDVVEITDVQTSCSCVKAIKPTGLIGPNEHGVIELHYRADMKSGPFQQVAAVRTSDSEIPLVELVATGYVPPYAQAIPKHLTLGKLAMGKILVRDLRVTGLLKQGAITGVLCDSDDITIAYSLLTRDDIVRESKINEDRHLIGFSGDQGEILRLVITGQKRGAAKGNIIINTNQESAPQLIIPFAAEVYESHP